MTVKLTLVLCDICEEKTGYEAEQGYAEKKKHFCRSHDGIERMFDNLEDYPKAQELFFTEAKEKYERDNNSAK